MTQYSGPWDGDAIGDALALAPYSASEWDDRFQASFLAGPTPHEDFGVWRGFLNELEVTGVATPVTVDTGGGLVNGKWFLNDAAVTVAVASPAGATRTDYIALECDWTGVGILGLPRTIRAVNIQNPVEGSGTPPALTQTAEAIWQIPIAIIDITVGGVITVTDDRHFLNEFHRHVHTLAMNACYFPAGHNITTGQYYNYNTVLLTFLKVHAGDPSYATWQIDISDWDEESDIVVEFWSINDEIAPGDGGDTRWELRSSQPTGHCEDFAYEAAASDFYTCPGAVTWHVALIPFTLTYADGFRKASPPLNLSFTRWNNDAADTSADNWRVIAGRVRYNT